MPTLDGLTLLIWVWGDHLMNAIAKYGALSSYVAVAAATAVIFCLWTVKHMRGKHETQLEIIRKWPTATEGETGAPISLVENWKFQKIYCNARLSLFGFDTNFFENKNVHQEGRTQFLQENVHEPYRLGAERHTEEVGGVSSTSSDKPQGKNNNKLNQKEVETVADCNGKGSRDPTDTDIWGKKTK